MKQDIKSMNLEELEQALTDLGQPKFRAKQVFTWLHRGARSFDEMTNLAKPLRQTLDGMFYISAPRVARKQESQRDGTIKYLWELDDGNCVETVLMRYKYGNTVCVSSEVGCAMGCAFCASTLGGLVRRLTAGEILDQVLFTQLDSGRPISHIVLMGIGEPLDNFDAVIRFLELVNHPSGLNIGMRHISLSTCGLTERIDKLASLHLQLTLSVSLHAPDDETRNRIMPVNRAVGVDRLLETCRRYYAGTGRRISFEYAMIDGVNDTRYHAELLVKKLRGMGAHVNMIPLNNVEESPLKPSSREHIRQFQQILERAGITATVRRSLGGDIDASCGQLRRKQMLGEKQGPRGDFMEVWGATDQGMVRKQNQDYYRCQSLGKRQYLAVVCDGMGGSKSGDVASKLASEVFLQDVTQTVHPQMEQTEIVKMLVTAVKSANRAVYEQSKVSPDFDGMGTTLVSVFLQDDDAYIVNVGDSRCYYVSGDVVSQITEDHSVVGLMVSRGQITEEEARTHPNKNLITRAVGTEPDVECDCFYLGLDKGEYLLLCSDGLSNMVTRPELLYEITHGLQDRDCCRRMIDIAKKRGAPDNVTAVLIKY